MLAVFAFVVATHVAAADPAPCANPRTAAATILSNLREDRLDLRKASRCVEDGGVSRSDREQALVVLKQALDAVGARVRLDELPDSADFVDPKSFEPVVPLSHEIPRVRLERLDDGQWMIPKSVVVEADKIYDDAVAFDLVKLKRSFPAWTQRAVFGVAAWQALGLALVFLVGLVLRAGLIRVLVWKSALPLAKIGVRTTPEGLTAAARPLGTLLLCAVVFAGAPSLAFGGRLASALLLVVRVSAALAALTFCYRAVDVVAEHFVKRAAHTSTKMDDHLVPLVRRSLRIAVIALAVVVVLQQFDVNVGSLIAGLGIGGLAVALAAKDTIGNFFGSVAIFLDRPFQIGDWVTAGSDVEGTVEHVGFRSTQIRTIRDTVVTVPNQKLAELNVDNWGARRARRVKVTAALEYGTPAEKLEAFCDGVRAILAAHPHTRKDDVEVHVNDFTESAVSVYVHFYIVRPTWSAELRCRHEILVDVLRLARDLGVNLAYPTRTIKNAIDDAASSVDVDDLLTVVQSYGPGGARSIAAGPRILPAPPSEPAPAPKEASAPPRNP